MGKIQFRSDKTKTKVFEDRNDTKKTALPINEKVDSWAKIQKEKPVKSGDEKPQYRNAAEVYEYLYNKLTLKYNIDTISVYQLYDNKNTDGCIIKRFTERISVIMRSRNSSAIPHRLSAPMRQALRITICTEQD